MTKRYNILTRCLAASALLFVYAVSTSAILVGASTGAAQAQRGRGRGGWGRGGYGRGGWGRGRGFYRGYGYARGPRCWWSPRGVRVCRY